MLDETRNIPENGVPIAISIDLSKGSGFLVEGGERLSLRLKFLQALLQHIGIVVVAPDEWTIAIGAYRAFGENRATQAGREATTLTLQPVRDPITDGLRGDIEPDRQIEGRPKTSQNVPQAFRLRDRAREAIENKPMATVQPQPVFDEFNNNLVGNQFAMLRRVTRLQPKRRPQISFAAQNGPGRSHRNTELPGDHFGLSSLSGTRRTQEHQSPFHLVPVEKNRHTADHEDGDGDIEPH